MCADWVGGPSTYRFCASPFLKEFCMARLRIVLRLGSLFDYGARGLNVITLLSLVEFSKGDANQKFPFLLFAFRRRGRGRSRAKNARKFWVCRARPRARRGAFSAIGAYLVGTQYSARGACASDRILFEIRPNFAVQSPQNNEEYFPLQEGLHIKEKGRDCSRPECLALELIKQQSSKLFNRIEHLFMLSDY